MTKMDLLDNKKALKFFTGGMIEPILDLGYFGVRCKKRENKAEDNFIDLGDDFDDSDTYDTEEEDVNFMLLIDLRNSSKIVLYLRK